ncbi:MAG: hypothetical protein JSW51_07565 [Gemmatimonadota bacterium]|nr:MAG: hypothetical protein JSW51_07565 [Gemmatimonadota bacterium]
MTGNENGLRRRLRWLWIVVLSLFAVVAVNAFSSDNGNQHGPIPDEVLGTWTTTESRYADRAFDIQKETLVLFIGDGDSTVHAIEDVEIEDLGGPLLLTVHYSDEEGPNKFAFYYDPVDGGLIRFKNQRHMKWNRSS